MVDLTDEFTQKRIMTKDPGGTVKQVRRLADGQRSASSLIYTGIDIIEISRIAEVARRYPKRFLEKIYTPGERAYSRGRAPQLASRFAAKEAVMKALGTGVRGVGWREIEVVRPRGRAPEVVLHGRAKAKAREIGIVRTALSLSHSRDYAVASVVAITAEVGDPKT